VVVVCVAAGAVDVVEAAVVDELELVCEEPPQPGSRSAAPRHSRPIRILMLAA
jgi:hypothetical protein